jgi:hypothetical protein
MPGSWLLSLTLAGWVLLELCVRVRESVHGRGRTGHDRFTRVLIATTIGGAIALAVKVSHARSLEIADLARAAGLAITWVGLAIRIEEAELTRVLGRHLPPLSAAHQALDPRTLVIVSARPATSALDAHHRPATQAITTRPPRLLEGVSACRRTRSQRTAPTEHSHHDY